MNLYQQDKRKRADDFDLIRRSFICSFLFFSQF